MYAVTVSFRLKPGAAEQFMPLMLENARTSLAQEEGCKRFDVCTDPARPDEVFLYELYDNRAMFDAHLATAHFETFDRASHGYVLSKQASTFAQVQS